MSLNKKDVYAWLLLAFAAILIAGGLRLSRQQRLMADAGIEETTQLAEISYPVSEAIGVSVVDSTKVQTSLSGESFSSATHNRSSAATNDPVTAAAEINETIVLLDTAEDEEPFPRMVVPGIICIITGSGIVIAVMILLRQNSPMIGPDAAAALVILASAYDLYRWNYVIGLALFLFILLTSIREMIGWLSAHCRPSWLLVIRLSYVLTQLAYGRDIRHFSTQLDRFQEGKAIEIKEGLYAGMEEKLQQIQEEHARAIKEAVTSERFKVDLIANVSHDLRTPLTAIIGYGELLQGENLSGQGEKQLEQLNRKAGYMRDLVDELFELTKVSSGVLEPTLSRIDLVSLLEQTIGLMQDELDVAGLVVKRNYVSDSLPLTTDGSRMHQVFANLLENAAKYALQGSRIYVYADRKGDEIQVRVVNTASYEMDFSPEEIMQRFARGDKARSTQGSGLGLAIAKTYTESVGGRFEIQIDGDQFDAIVYLPAMRSDAKAMV